MTILTVVLIGAVPSVGSLAGVPGCEVALCGSKGKQAAISSTADLVNTV